MRLWRICEGIFRTGFDTRPGNLIYLSRVVALGITYYAVGERMGQGKFMGCMYSPTFLPSAENMIAEADGIVNWEIKMPQHLKALRQVDRRDNILLLKL